MNEMPFHMIDEDISLCSALSQLKQEHKRVKELKLAYW
jgi:hypothetical protein